MIKHVFLAVLLCSTYILAHSQNSIPKEVLNESPSLRGLSLRSNAIPWIVLTPSLGLEYRPTNSFSVLVNGAYAHWTWDKSMRRHHLWQIAPQVRYYVGVMKDSYIGLEGQVGEYNLKHSMIGRQGNFMGGGVSLGHQFVNSKRLLIDLGISLGYLRFKDAEKYERINNVNTRMSKGSHNYWGLTGASVTFVWKIN